MIQKKTSLLDLKLKQIKALDKVVSSLNYGNNEYGDLLTKLNTQKVIESIATAQSEYDLAFHSICEVLKVGKEDLLRYTPDLVENEDLKKEYSTPKTIQPQMGKISLHKVKVEPALLNNLKKKSHKSPKHIKTHYHHNFPTLQPFFQRNFPKYMKKAKKMMKKHYK